MKKNRYVVTDLHDIPEDITYYFGILTTSTPRGLSSRRRQLASASRAASEAVCTPRTGAATWVRIEEANTTRPRARRTSGNITCTRRAGPTQHKNQ